VLLLLMLGVGMGGQAGELAVPNISMHIAQGTMPLLLAPLCMQNLAIACC